MTKVVVRELNLMKQEKHGCISRHCFDTAKLKNCHIAAGIFCYTCFFLHVPPVASPFSAVSFCYKSIFAARPYCVEMVATCCRPFSLQVHFAAGLHCLETAVFCCGSSNYPFAGSFFFLNFQRHNFSPVLSMFSIF